MKQRRPGPDAALLEGHRPRLIALAYRMLGSVASAEDVVQETLLRASRAEGVRRLGPWMTTVCTRLCLDELRSARARREQYVGAWLPEPALQASPGPGLLGESLTTAFLLLLQRLSARERAAWLLREVFDEDYAHIAAILDSTEPAVRQLVRRARAAVDADRPRYEVDPGSHAALLAAFGAAVASGDTAALEALLADDVRFVGDGGGVRPSALRPVTGARSVARLFGGLWRKAPPGATVEPVVLNGGPGILVRAPDGTIDSAMTVSIAGGVLIGFYNVRNPDKLLHLRAPGSTPGSAGDR